MALATVNDIRDIISLTSDAISDEAVNRLIKKAQIKIARDLYVHIEEEWVEYVDEEKQNLIDGSNSTLYTRYYPIVDANQDGLVNTSDVHVYKFDNDGVRTEVTLSSITASLGKIELSEVTDTNYYYKITYCTMYQNITDSDLNLLCTFYVAGLCYLKAEPAVLKHFDTLDVIRMPDGADKYFKQYNELLKIVKSQMMKRGEDIRKVDFDNLRSNLPRRKYYNIQL